MSNVTDMFVLIGDTEFAAAEDTAPKVAEVIADYVYDEAVPIPVISLQHPNWDTLQSGKVAGSACIWFGWNHAHPDELAALLKSKGFTNITIWTHREYDGIDGIAPKVVSW
jgi:hypothetical protein